LQRGDQGLVRGHAVRALLSILSQLQLKWGGKFSLILNSSFNSFPVAARNQDAVRDTARPHSFNSFPVAARRSETSARRAEKSFNSFPVAARKVLQPLGSPTLGFQFFPSCSQQDLRRPPRWGSHRLLSILSQLQQEEVPAG